MKREGDDKNTWYLYILECKDGSLYTGITNDLERRIEMHGKGKGAKFTRSRLPLRVVHTEECENRSDALRKESAIKGMRRIQKEEYVRCHEKRGDREVSG